MNRLVIGCGYIGLPTAEKWLANGDSVSVFTRSPERASRWESLGLQPIVGDITQPESFGSFPAADTVLFAVGMDRSRYDNIRDVYVSGLKNVLGSLSDETGQFIYISSTGVYGQSSGVVDEQSPAEPVREGGRACLEAENLLKQSRFSDRLAILRLAGIYGPGRVPTLQKVKEKKLNLHSASGYLNLIHRDDAVQTIHAVADRRIVNETILVSDGTPLLRRDYYTMLADILQPGSSLELSAGSTGEGSATRRSSGKQVCNDKMMRLTGLKLLWPDVRKAIEAAIAGEGKL